MIDSYETIGLQWDDSGMFSIYQLVHNFATIHCTKAMKVALEIYSVVRRERFGAKSIHIWLKATCSNQVFPIYRKSPMLNR